jgi:glucokinase
MILAGDIGGTKTQLAIFNSNALPFSPTIEATFASRDYDTLESVISGFLKKTCIQVDMICLGVAGPVIEGRAELTNLPWVVSEEQLCSTFNVKTSLVINDLMAMACAVPGLEPGDFLVLNEGNAVKEGNIAVIAPGTGLGEAFLVWDGFRYVAYSSEGGHTSFGPVTPREIELLQYIHDKFGYALFEKVCSGPGIFNIYRFLKERGYGEEPEWLRDRINGVEDAVPEIIAAAMNRDNPCRLCVDTLKLFASVLGNEAGNMGLKFMAINGVYLGGGIVPRILPFLKDDAFGNSFRCKGRMSDLVSGMPVRAILHPAPALYGAALYARDYMMNGIQKS